MVLGLLASHGPRHGHQIRRVAERTNVGNWGGVSVGALYREIRQLEQAGLVEAVKTEQVGRRPARTVYRITDAGTRALSDLRGEAIRGLQFGPDAFGVALLFGRTWARSELEGLLRDRRQAISTAKEGLEAECAEHQARGAIGPLDVALFRRRALQLEAELRWLDEFDGVLATLPEPEARAAEDVEGSEAVPETPTETRARGTRKRRKT